MTDTDNRNRLEMGDIFSKKNLTLFILFALILTVISLFSLRASGDRTATIIYLTLDDDGVFQLAQITADGAGEPHLLTDHDHDVREYAISPDGEQIIYTVTKEDGRSDLWLIESNGRNNNLILECLEAACSAPVWSPTPGRLVYERRDIPTPNSSPDLPRLWWLDLAGQVTVPVADNSQWYGWGAQFSPDGAWLSLIVPLVEEVQAYHFESGETVAILSRAGEPPFWGPDGTFYVTDVELIGEAVTIHLFQVDLETNTLVDLSGTEARVNDSGFAWSPDGATIAFTRNPSRTPSGKQIWLMSKDGSEQRSLTQMVDLHHGPPQWSAVGDRLVYQVYDLTALNESPEIWVMSLATGEQTKLTTGIRPSWLE